MIRCYICDAYATERSRKGVAFCKKCAPEEVELAQSDADEVTQELELEEDDDFEVLVDEETESDWMVPDERVIEELDLKFDNDRTIGFHTWYCLECGAVGEGEMLELNAHVAATHADVVSEMAELAALPDVRTACTLAV